MNFIVVHMIHLHRVHTALKGYYLEIGVSFMLFPLETDELKHSRLVEGAATCGRNFNKAYHCNRAEMYSFQPVSSLLLFYVLVTTKVISGWVTVHTYGDFIVLP